MLSHARHFTINIFLATGNLRSNVLNIDIRLGGKHMWEHFFLIYMFCWEFHGTD